MDPGPNQLQKRNVEVYNSTGYVVAGVFFRTSSCLVMLTKVGGFWQYNTLQWDDFYRYLISFVVTVADWTIFRYDPIQNQHGAPCPPTVQVVQPGHYILLSNSELTL